MISKYIGTYIKIKINNTGDQYSICIYICDYQHSLCCEVKPTLGDDYTCVLRKLKEQIDRTNNDKSLIGCGFSSWEKVYVLIIGTFTSASATKEQLIKIFGQTGIKIVFTNEIFGQTKINMIQPVNIELEQANLWFLDTNELIEEIRLLKERNTHLEERNTHLEEEIRLLKERKKPGKLIKHYFEKK